MHEPRIRAAEKNVLEKRDSGNKTRLRKPRGILRREQGFEEFRLTRFAPCGWLAGFVEHYWSVVWDLEGRKPHVQETLPHPSVVLVVEGGSSRIVAVVTGRFTRLLENKGFVLGVKFRPGGFYPFARFPITEITDRVVPLAEVFGRASDNLERTVLEEVSEARRAKLAEEFLLTRLPEPDENVDVVDRAVDRILSEPEIRRVEDLVDSLGVSKRGLQRLFQRYVGVSPNWVIQRYRLHEAVERLEDRPDVDWASLAQDLGYFDQSHFIQDFKSVVGFAPGEYVAKLRRGSQP